MTPYSGVAFIPTISFWTKILAASARQAKSSVTMSYR